MTTTSLKLHVMPSDQVRADAALAAGERLQAVGALLWRCLVAIGRASDRKAAVGVSKR